jgi:hypothetical protein
MAYVKNLGSCGRELSGRMCWLEESRRVIAVALRRRRGPADRDKAGRGLPRRVREHAGGPSACWAACRWTAGMPGVRPANVHDAGYILYGRYAIFAMTPQVPGIALWRTRWRICVRCRAAAMEPLRMLPGCGGGAVAVAGHAQTRCRTCPDQLPGMPKLAAARPSATGSQPTLWSADPLSHEHLSLTLSEFRTPK